MACMCSGTGTCGCSCGRQATYYPPGDNVYIPEYPNYSPWIPLPAPLPYNPLTHLPYNPIPNPQNQTGWVCQKCGRSYSPQTYQCFPCNNEVDQKKNG